MYIYYESKYVKMMKEVTCQNFFCLSNVGIGME